MESQKLQRKIIYEAALGMRMTDRYGGQKSPTRTPAEIKDYLRRYGCYNSNLGAVVKRILRNRNEGANIRQIFDGYQIKEIYDRIFAKRTPAPAALDAVKYWSSLPKPTRKGTNPPA